MDRFLWLVVGFVAGSIGGAAANEAISRCGCAPESGSLADNGAGALALLEGELADVELAARAAVQHAQQFGYDTLSEAQILAINAWEGIDSAFEKTWNH